MKEDLRTMWEFACEVWLAGSATLVALSLLSAFALVGAFRAIGIDLFPVALLGSLTIYVIGLFKQSWATRILFYLLATGLMTLVLAYINRVT